MQFLCRHNHCVIVSDFEWLSRSPALDRPLMSSAWEHRKFLFRISLYTSYTGVCVVVVVVVSEVFSFPSIALIFTNECTIDCIQSAGHNITPPKTPKRLNPRDLCRPVLWRRPFARQTVIWYDYLRLIFFRPFPWYSLTLLSKMSGQS